MPIYAAAAAAAHHNPLAAGGEERKIGLGIKMMRNYAFKARVAQQHYMDRRRRRNRYVTIHPSGADAAHGHLFRRPSPRARLESRGSSETTMRDQVATRSSRANRKRFPAPHRRIQIMSVPALPGRPFSLALHCFRRSIFSLSLSRGLLDMTIHQQQDVCE